MSHARLGRFELGEELSRGGMGVVYRARHADGTPVAIKVILPEHAETAESRHQFRREVHAMARLNHPNVVHVFDVGTVGEQSAGGLTPGTPWMAMELLDGGSLSPTCVHDWSQLRRTLLSLLEALAHAHAADLIHRDLKPNNVLLARGDDAEIKLVDFGIAHALHRGHSEGGEAGSERVAGTPNYMAPEQVAGEWRDQGPWTDLYALGCLAWCLATGHAPFEADQTEEILHGQLNRTPPSFEPRFPVPGSFVPWLFKLLEKRPYRRFQRAARAAGQLRGMDAPHTQQTADVEAQATAGEPTVMQTGTFPTLECPQERELGGASTEIVDAAPEDVDEAFELGGGTDALALPPYEEVVEEGGCVRRLGGVGLGLFGLRTPPVIGREAICRLLWRRLCEADAEGRPRAVALCGPSGCGKSHLAQWLARRAHEKGASLVLTARHNPHGGPLDGLSAMLRGLFRVDGLERDEVVERVRRVLREQAPDLGERERVFDALTLANMITSTSAQPLGGEGRAVSASRDERFAAVQRLLGQLSRRRPVVFWVDDAQWADETLTFVRRVLEQSREMLAVLIVMTVRRVDEHHETSRQLQQLFERDDCSVEELEPLSRAQQRELVEAMLPLEPSLVDEVVARTGGNPLFGVQLLTDWVEQGVLVSTEESHDFSFEEAAEPTLPETVEELWRERIEHLLEGLSESRRARARRALEMAALVGPDIARREWRWIARFVGLERPVELVDEMAKRKLARTAATGWSFRHAALGESLASIAEEGGRLVAHHRRCVELLDDLYGDDDPFARERRGHHLLEAGDYREALAPLEESLHWAISDGTIGQLGEYIARFEEAIERLALEEDDRERALLDAFRGLYCFRHGDFERGEEVLDRAIEVSRRRGWSEAMSLALIYRGLSESERGKLESASSFLAEAVERARSGGRLLWEARALLRLAVMHRASGQTDEMIASLERVRQICRAAGEMRLFYRAEGYLGYAYLTKSRYARARRHFERVAEHCEKAGRRIGLGMTLGYLGDLARFEEDWQEAYACYERARELAESFGSRTNLILSFNMALTKVGERNWPQVRERCEELEQTLVDATYSQIYLAHLRLALAACAANAGNRAEFDERVASARALLEETGAAEKDIVWISYRVGLEAERADWPDAARRLFALSAELAARIGDEPSRERARRKLSD